MFLQNLAEQTPQHLNNCLHFVSSSLKLFVNPETYILIE